MPKIKILMRKTKSVGQFCIKYIKMRKQQGQMTLGQRRHPKAASQTLKECHATSPMHTDIRIQVDTHKQTHTEVQKCLSLQAVICPEGPSQR